MLLAAHENEHEALSGPESENHMVLALTRGGNSATQACVQLLAAADHGLHGVQEHGQCQHSFVA